jgi:heme-degrading monooxygenase HmoA
MYTMVLRRRPSPNRQQEMLERAQKEFFPKLQAAPGFGGFYLVRDEGSGVTVAIVVWESKEQADAFRADGDAWQRALDEMGSTLESRNEGETIVTIPPPH